MRILFALIAFAGCATGTTNPTATLTANGETELVADVGQDVIYEWSSEHADTAQSTVTIDDAADACGNTNGPWVIETPEGARAPEPILPCQAGERYTIQLQVSERASGERATATLVITVR
ncbi:MAG TPA: hypothetical protein VIU61_24570 [Kofleriaceae bacterium]